MGRAMAQVRDGNGGRIIAENGTKNRIIRPGTNPDIPTVRYARRVMSRFELLYDRHMYKTGHYQTMNLMLRDFETSLVGSRKVVDIGSGTGVNLAYIAQALMAEEILDLESRQNEGPITLIALDNSRGMIRRSKIRMRKALEEIRRCDQSGADLQIIEDVEHPTKMVLALVRKKKQKTGRKTTNDLVVVKFVTRNMLAVDQGRGELRQVVQDADIVLQSYIYHWLRGMEEKRMAIEKTFGIIKEGGRLISLEENPLVVTINDNNTASVKLAEAIEKATTVIDIEDLHKMFMDAGFGPILHGSRRREIDRYHSMFGIVVEKPTEAIMIEESEEPTADPNGIDNGKSTS